MFQKISHVIISNFKHLNHFLINYAILVNYLVIKYINAKQLRLMHLYLLFTIIFCGNIIRSAGRITNLNSERFNIPTNLSTKDRKRYVEMTRRNSDGENFSSHESDKKVDVKFKVRNQ